MEDQSIIKILLRYGIPLETAKAITFDLQYAINEEIDNIYADQQERTALL